MDFASQVSRYLRAAGDWARGTTVSGSQRVQSGYAGALPVVPSRFRILEVLGAGGMGIVYRAFDTELGREVALKSLRELSPEHTFYLKNEFRSLADLSHPNLVELYELHVDKRGVFFTMELIRGSDLVQYVRGQANDPSAAPCYQRLRESARQLATAIQLLHEQGKLHRDIKPSNVLVTPSGRVVLLDFGLVTALAAGFEVHAEARVCAGTVEFMAPEQLAGQQLTASADWYSLGATLYRALVGRLAHEGSRTELAQIKARPLDHRLTELAPTVPADLDQLVFRLLSPEPALRPTGPEVLALLGGQQTQNVPMVGVRPPQDSVTFTGRAHELCTLLAQFEEVRAGATRVVTLSGPSGIGKSELARQFLRLAHAKGATVLASRCHPREVVVFNAIDGLVDSLSGVLSRLEDEAIALPAEDASALVRLFPVLGQARGMRHSAPDSTGATLYRRAFAALRTLLLRLSEQSPLVLWIDDAQWADADSGKLLRDLLRPPGQPQILLLLTARSEGSLDEQSADALLGDMAEPWLHSLTLAPLSRAESLELAQKEVGTQANIDDRDLVRWLADAAGSPFFIRELTCYLLGATQAQTPIADELSLDFLLRERLRALSREEHELVVAAALAGGPLEQRVLLRAAGLDLSQQPLLNGLVRASILTTSKVGPALKSDIYHHLIRSEVLASVSEPDRKRIHRALAEALTAETTPNLTRALEHYEAVAALAEVRRYIVAAANQASAALAFELAAQLYRRALELGGSELREHQLLRRLAESHADAGWGAQAGKVYEDAAAAASRAGADDDARENTRLAAEQYLQAGDNAAGLRLLERTLHAAGLKLPGSRKAALRELLFHRARLAVRGLDYEPRPADSHDRAAVERAEASWLVWRTITLVDHTTGIAFAARFLLEALELGDANGVLRGLAAEAVALSATPTKLVWPRVNALLHKVDALNNESGDRMLRAGFYQCRGIAMWFRGELRATVRDLDRAIASYRGLRRAVAFDIANCEAFRVPALALLGEVARLRSEASEIMQDAERRGDRFVLRNITAGQCSLAWIAADDCDTALALADSIVSSLPDSDSYSIQHYYRLLSHTQVALYRGQGRAAWQLVESQWRELVRSHFLLVSFNRDEARQLRARAALAHAEELARQGSERGELRVLLHRVRHDALAIEAHGLGPGRPWAELLMAGAERIEGRSASAAAFLGSAAEGFDAEEMRLYAAAARYALGALQGGEAGQQLCAEARTWMLSQGIRAPACVVAMLAPGAFSLRELPAR